MNAKARSLKLLETHFEDTTGLSSGNIQSQQPQNARSFYIPVIS